MRTATLSALDAIADGPQAKAFGITRRLHDVAERYAAMLIAASGKFTAHEFLLITRAIGTEELPGIGARSALRHQLSAYLVAAAKTYDRKSPHRAEHIALARRMIDLDTAQLVALLERIEEDRYRGA